MARSNKSIRFILTVSGLLGGLGLFLISLLVEPATAPADIAPPNWERFSTYEADTCLNPATPLGSWRVEAVGGGCVKVERDPARSWIHLEPAAGSSALVLGPGGSDFELTADLLTVSAARSSQLAWLAWNYISPNQYYYFVPGPYKWEVGRMDPSGETVLASGSSPRFPVGAWYRIKLVQSGGQARVTAGGSDLAVVATSGAGRVGLYSTGTHAHFTNLYHRPLASDGPATAF